MRHSNALLFPPTSQHTQEIISRQGQFLHPQESVQPIRGHMRRASSGSRAERPVTWSNSSSQRASPYISPSASPHPRYEELPNDQFNGSTTPAMNIPEPGGIVVSKPNVTTGRTANASHKRRKQEANFRCPVPGCGSTFTRSFNLKGASLFFFFAQQFVYFSGVPVVRSSSIP